METKTKKYEDLNKYERVMTNASLEQRLEAMAKDLEQMALALKMSIHINATFTRQDNHSVEVSFFPKSFDSVVGRDVENVGDLFGIIEEALGKS